MKAFTYHQKKSDTVKGMRRQSLISFPRSSCFPFLFFFFIRVSKLSPKNIKGRKWNRRSITFLLLTFPFIPPLSRQIVLTHALVKAERGGREEGNLKREGRKRAPPKNPKSLACQKSLRKK